ncbi:hypothetical protein N0V82_001116 [Gnomoniopsis sp. IMI 355080]|nr:hypothetical protein N0V82_001116 [Gnomoniopsis sp. IMI 355080]
MVTRKPLPGSADVDPQFTNPVKMPGTQEPLVDGILDEQTTKHLNDQDPDSDTDSWERASDNEDESENEEGGATHESHPPSSEEKQQNHQAPARGGDGTTDEGGNGEGPSRLQQIKTGDGGNDTTGETPALDLLPPTLANSTPSETNPFRRKMSLSSVQRSVNMSPPSTEPPPIPPSEELAKLSVHSTGSNPWDAFDDQHETIAQVNPSSVADQEPAQDIWGSQVPSRTASTGPPPSDSKPVDLGPPEEAPAWDYQASKDSSIVVPASFRKSLEGEELAEDSHAWDDLAAQDKGKSPMKTPDIANNSAEGANEESWNLIDNGTGLGPQPGSSGSADPSKSLIEVDEDAPALPPRNDEKAPAYSPRTPISAKAETYQVKNINWLDAKGPKNPRKSPILIQNANGPCPLMALVNALTLTTPFEAEEAVLVNTLRTREQISLDLLLNAVFDELMSERRMTEDVSLPDMTELYDFLLGLHTGMNVNPRFIPTEEMETAFKRTSLTHLHPHERGDLIPGTFEDTKEMAFYRIFQIPLIHGWLPSKEDAVYEALKRQAQSYEDAQNLLFREEELEDKLSSPGGEALTEEEQAIYQDILNIKSFLDASATQLTTWGLEVITKAMRPGSVAILFRNDHFSTLYRHPETLEIFALVTDAGYAGHEEIVWESLCDVNGERSEFVSGDFKIVGGPAQNHRPTASSSASVATPRRDKATAQSQKGKEKPQSEDPPLSASEQEDRDLALAMQLQDEEDQRHHRERAQRRRESQLSEQFIEQQAVRRGPVGLRQPNGNNGSQQTPSSPASQRNPSTASTPARGGRPTGPQQVRSLVPPAVRSRGVTRPADAEVEDAPPSYEDAARDRPYVPPAGHPSHPNSSPVPSTSAPRLPPSRAPGIAAGSSGPRRGSNALRQGVPPATTSGGRDKDCVVM